MGECFIPPLSTGHNLENYEEACKNYRLEDWKKHFSWHQTGKVNLAYECVDRHVEKGKRDKIALYFSSENRKESYTYGELRLRSNQFGNLLKKKGIQKGDRVFLFMPRSPEFYISMLGILKIGAIAAPLFETFMEDAVKDRLEDSEAIAIVTTPALLPRIPKNKLPALKHIILVSDSKVIEKEYVDYYEEMKKMPTSLDIEWLDLDDGMMLHYTSRSTEKPKGILHAQRAMIQYYMTAYWVLDLKEEDVFWCTADPWWITGTSYGVFAPWLFGITNVVKGGGFNPDIWYQTMEDYKVSVWYSTPTVFRMLMTHSNLVEKYNLSSLRHILSVGEPLSPEVIHWGLKTYGKRIHDTWWMPEMEAPIICNYPSIEMRPGSMGKPIPGVEVTIMDDEGNILQPNQTGNLAIKKGWPAMMKTIWNHPEKYDSYFLNDWYVSEDAVYMDEDGYFWFQGRIEDVIMTTGGRVEPFEIENKLLEHPAVQEAGVIGKPDAVRGEIIKAFISLVPGVVETPELIEEIKDFVKQHLAAHAVPKEIEVKETLPKTQSGKMLRRVLKSWELELSTGDLSTLKKN